ncbi:MAG: hypothetical protein HC900_05015 [Methylacidiphilales bacterium]|nr:hypothetical protein [Candidatus Methylacidiphilales bacterium]
MDTLLEIQRAIYAMLTSNLRAFAETRDWDELFVVLPLEHYPSVTIQ